MNCEVAHERIVTAAYGELPDDEVHELERHLQDCEDCRQEREQVQALQVITNALPVLEPDANLIARARMRLDEALDALPPQRWYERWGQRIRKNFAGLTSVPVAALLVAAVSLGAGGYGGFRLAQRQGAAAQKATVLAASGAAGPLAHAASAALPAAQVKPNLADVATVTAIKRRPGTEMVDVSYNELVPQHVTGSLDDPQIRELLMMASENQTSARVRGDSVSLLALECKRGHSCQPSGIRDALMVALRYDANPTVRQEALVGLEPYVATDMRVRDAVLEALMTDSDPLVRSASIRMLAPVEADTSVRQVLSTVSTTDNNPHIRYVSRQILDQVPEIQ